MSAIQLIGHGAVYVRISEDDQKADRQRKSTSEWIGRHGLDDGAVTVYEDLGWKRHQADKRPEFQRMLRDADDGRIKWIVCDALDRFGTKNKNQLLAYLYRLQEAGCQLYTANDKEWTGTDLLTLIEAGLEGEKSEKELRDKSERVLGAMRVMAEKGTWLGGRIPYGCDVVAFR